MVMRMDAAGQTESAKTVWPASPEIPRFRYVGQLTGDENFTPADIDSRGTAKKIFYWLVGLTGSNEERVVLQRPQSGMVDAAGRVYVTDVSRQAVFVFDQAAGELRVWERAEGSDKFVAPVGIAAGMNGQILVADAELGRVFRLDAGGNPLGSFGAGVLKRPTGLARDPARGLVYVADTHAHDVKVFDDRGVLQETLGNRGEADGELNYPTHLAFADGKLYVSDSMNSRIQILDTQGHVLGKFGKRGLYVGNFTRPKGVALDGSGNIYVVESFYDNLLVFGNDGQFLMPIGGTGKGIGQFYLPAGVWCDAQNKVYVADMFNGRVVIFQALEGAP
jgi:DNA-binding beta-propeller fold protein YncE